MASVTARYHRSVAQILSQICSSEAHNLEAAAELAAKALAADEIIFIVGSGHSHMIAEEGFYRAGGIAALQAILEPRLMLHDGAIASTAAERELGLAATVIAKYPVTSGSVVVVVSNSGRNAYPIEMALEAKARGAKVIAITSRAMARSVPSRHPSGKLLADFADVVIDNHVPVGDAVLELPRSGKQMGPTSTIAGAFIINAMLAEAVERAKEAGCSLDVYSSANGINQGESAENIATRWEGRIIGL
ncbi:MAG: sugar isomerase domain-containing protein [Aestuariivirga sp.]